MEKNVKSNQSLGLLLFTASKEKFDTISIQMSNFPMPTELLYAKL